MATDGRAGLNTLPPLIYIAEKDKIDMEKKRRVLLSTLIKTLEYHQMDINEMGDFFVEFQESKMVDQFFGKLSAKTREEVNDEELIVVRNRLIRPVIGNVSNLHLLRGMVPGIEPNKDGSCTIDMTTEWIVKFGITEEDFRNGNRRLMLAPDAQKLLKMSSNSFVNNRFFKDKTTKFGKIWAIDYTAVEQYKENRENPQISLVSQKS